jgi:hypothetical protein
VPLGHGIDVERAGAAFLDAPDTRKGVIFAGRIYPIKNLEECIVAISKSTIKDKSFVVIGPHQSTSSYSEILIKLASESGVSLRFEVPISHDSIFRRMSSAQMFYAGMKKSVDKSCLEAAATGCFIITSDIASSRLSGMDSIWKEITGSRKLPELHRQLELLESLDKEEEAKYRIFIHLKACEINSAGKIAENISSFLKNYGV